MGRFLRHSVHSSRNVQKLTDFQQQL